MKMKKLLLLPALLLTLSVGNVACSYHNDDNPNEYPDPQPEPEPEPEQPCIQIGVPAKDLTVANVTNLIYMRYLQYEGEKVLRQQANPRAHTAANDRQCIGP